MVDVPITWGSLLGVTLLWGRFDHARGWQRRVGPLLVMSSGSRRVVAARSRRGTGTRRRGGVGHDWLRGNLGQALGWAETRAHGRPLCDYLEHLGVEDFPASRASRRDRSTALTAPSWLLLLSASRPTGRQAGRSGQSHPVARGISARGGLQPHLGNHPDPGDGVVISAAVRSGRVPGRTTAGGRGSSIHSRCRRTVPMRPTSPASEPGTPLDRRAAPGESPARRGRRHRCVPPPASSA